MAGFYAARSGTIPPLPWTNFAPPLSLIAASGKTRRSFRCSQKVLMGLAALAGQKQAADRLLSSLQVDCRSTCDALDWTPPFTSDEGLRRTVTTAM